MLFVDDVMFQDFIYSLLSSLFSQRSHAVSVFFPGESHVIAGCTKRSRAKLETEEQLHMNPQPVVSEAQCALEGYSVSVTGALIVQVNLDLADEPFL